MASNRSGARVASTPKTRTSAVPRAVGLDGQPWLFALALLLWLGLLAALTWLDAWPAPAPMVLGALALLNAATFLAYLGDKRAAERGYWRTPEKTLHTLAAAGGWPAAGLAQRTLRHKSRKVSFLLVYGLTVLLHLTALAALLWRASA